MGWIIGLVLLAVALKVLWIVLVFAAPVLIPLAAVVGGLFALVWLREVVEEILTSIGNARVKRRLMREAGTDSSGPAS